MTIYVIVSSALLVLTAGLAVLDAEQNAPGSNITNIGDALWWAFATITTVGYGDYYPVTILGRMIAAALMVAGVAMLRTVTATLASWFVDVLSGAKAPQAGATSRVNDLEGPGSSTA